MRPDDLTFFFISPPPKFFYSLIKDLWCLIAWAPYMIGLFCIDWTHDRRTQSLRRRISLSALPRIIRVIYEYQTDSLSKQPTPSGVKKNNETKIENNIWQRSFHIRLVVRGGLARDADEGIIQYSRHQKDYHTGAIRKPAGRSPESPRNNHCWDQ